MNSAARKPEPRRRYKVRGQDLVQSLLALVAFDDDVPGGLVWTEHAEAKVLRAVAGQPACTPHRNPNRNSGYWMLHALCQTLPAHWIVYVLGNGLNPVELLGTLVDHRDGDGQNNRLSNLRAATQDQNARNRRLNRNSTSGFKGVTFEKQLGLWRARITFDGRRRSLGLFDAPERAARAYDNAAIALHGEFASTNFDRADLVRLDGGAPEPSTEEVSA